jgi:hypothetical protein
VTQSNYSAEAGSVTVGASETYCFCESQRVQYLEKLIVRLMFKNQVIRFELSATAEKLEDMRRSLFQLNTRALKGLTHSELLHQVQNLCKELGVSQPGGNRNSGCP